MLEMAKISIWLPLCEGSCLNFYQNRYKKAYILRRGFVQVISSWGGKQTFKNQLFTTKSKVWVFYQQNPYFAWFCKHLQPGAMDHHQIWYVHKWFMWGFNWLFILSQFHLTPNQGYETQKRSILLFLGTFSRPANSQPFISYLILSRR